MTAPHSTPRATPRFLSADAPPMLLFGGKGGVGKTTMACGAAMAHAAARPDEKVLLVSTDPAHSVRDALADAALPANLEVIELDAAAEHASFMAEHGATLHAIAARGTFLDDDDIHGFLELSLPGIDELMCFVRLGEWLETGRADRIIVDTAPTGHALRLLGMPQMLEGWVGAIEALLGKHRYMAELFGGRAKRDEVDAFVDLMTERFATVAEQWSDAATAAFVPVCNAEPLSLAETGRLLEQLDALEMAAPEVVVNRMIPISGDAGLTVRRAAQALALDEAGAMFAGRVVYGVPLMAGEPRGAALPSAVAALAPLATSGQSTPAAAAPAESAPARVVGGIPLPGAGTRVVMTAGKGGVGKTTVSAALAAAIAASGRRVLIVSTDPAGSLGDVFRREIGAMPVSVAPGLRAVQLDAETEFAALKDEYAGELERFLDRLSSAVDLAFDREALERLLDLAPTGLDEVMALVKVTEMLEADAHELLVIDTAPTGHLMRLLELPALVQDWLKAIFGVFLKYEHVFSLPKLNQRLLTLSRGLKALRAMLADAKAASVYPVAIPTRVCADETARLLAGVRGHGLHIAGVVINQVTPESSDPLAAALHEREIAEVERLRGMIGATPAALLFRGGDLRGAEVLASLGRALGDASANAKRRAA